MEFYTKRITALLYIMVFLIAGSIITWACKSTATTPPAPAANSKLFTAEYVPLQTYNINTRTLQRIRAKQGTIIEIRAGAFQKSDGTLYTGDADINMREYYSLDEMVLSGLGTASGDKPLSSGGMVHIAAAGSSGEFLSLRPDADVRLTFASKKGNRSFFTGRQLSNGNIDWQPAGKPVGLATMPSASGASAEFKDGTRRQEDIGIGSEEVYAVDSVLGGEKAPDVGDSMRLHRLGWVNLDRF